MVIHNETQYIAVPYSEPQFHFDRFRTPRSVGRRRCHRSKWFNRNALVSRLLPVRFSTISSCILSNWRSSRSQRQSIATGFSTHTRATKTRSRLHRFPETETISRSLSLLSRSAVRRRRRTVRRRTGTQGAVDDRRPKRRLRTVRASRLAVRPTASSGPREAISATDRLGPLFAGRADPYSHRRSRVLAKYASSLRTTAGLRMSHLSTHGPVMLIHSNR